MIENHVSKMYYDEKRVLKTIVMSEQRNGMTVAKEENDVDYILYYVD